MRERIYDVLDWMVRHPFEVGGTLIGIILIAGIIKCCDSPSFWGETTNFPEVVAEMERDEITMCKRAGLFKWRMSETWIKKCEFEDATCYFVSSGGKASLMPGHHFSNWRTNSGSAPIELMA